MKKNLKVFVALALVLSLALCLVACGGSSSLSGKYNLVSMTEGDSSISIKELEEMAGEDVEAYIEFNKDGTAELNLMGDVEDMKYGNSKIWAEGEEDDKADLIVKGSKVTIKIEDTEMVFEK